MRIQLSQYAERELSSREEGKRIRSDIEAAWDQAATITIDFENLLVASASVLDEAFALLLETRTLEEMKNKLKFVNIDPEDRSLLNYLILSRFKEKDIEEQGN